ncbi:DUF664 domain-containing protein [Streptosporangium sp. NPDC006013]|uniref:mycothiol transferase n=1 Tax=Streptosporangium sp. NPDC006013 TaxID=3155596 RepID=UPI0033B1E122
MDAGASDENAGKGAPAVGDEREILSSFLDWHRATSELKCADIPSERHSEWAVEPSSLSLHGLMRHLAGVEPPNKSWPSEPSWSGSGSSGWKRLVPIQAAEIVLK